MLNPHHYRDAQTAVREMVRVCKAGGLVALVANITSPMAEVGAYINRFETLRDPSHHWAHPLADLQAFFVAAGLRVEHTETLKKKMEFDPSRQKALGRSPDGEHETHGNA